MNDEENLTLHQKSLKALFHTPLHYYYCYCHLENVTVFISSQAVGDVFDLLTTLKLLCMRLWQNNVSGVDELRLDVALKMLKSPHFNAKMNSLKEVCF